MSAAFAERSTDAFLRVDGASKVFGSVTVLDCLDLIVSRGEFVSLLGPSGCGKTTLLRMIAGLLGADGGAIYVDGRDLTRVPAHRRNISVVFQNYALFPHMTVADNVAFGLKARRAASKDIEETVAKSLAMVHMSEYAPRSVLGLSGGQQQRVAVARALAVRPTLLLLDEPFSALDRKLREQMQIELRQLLRTLGITAVFVTHDQDEALIMSDRIAVMNKGLIEQFDTPSEIYNSPKTPFVLDFVGTSMRIHGKIQQSQGSVAEIATAVGVVRAPTDMRQGTDVLVAIRPEKVRPTGGAAAQTNDVKLRVVDTIFVGSKYLVHFEATGEDNLVAEINPGSIEIRPNGETMDLSWPVEDTLVFPLQPAELVPR